MLRRLTDNEKNKVAAITAAHGLTLQGGSVDDIAGVITYHLSVDSIGATCAASIPEKLRIALDADRVVLN